MPKASKKRAVEIKSKKNARNILWIFLVLLTLLVLGRDFLIKIAVEISVHQATGMKVSIEKLHTYPLKNKLLVKGLTVYNPRGFEGETLAKIPYVHVEYNLLSFLAGKAHLRYLEISFNEISIIKNAGKELNLNRIKAIASSGGKSRSKPDKESGPSIDTLVLSIDHLKSVDYSSANPKEGLILIGATREKFHNLRSMEDIIRVVVLRVALKAGLNNLGLPVRSLVGKIGHIGGSGMKGLIYLGGTVKSGVENTASKIKNIFKKPRQ